LKQKFYHDVYFDTKLSIMDIQQRLNLTVKATAAILGLAQDIEKYKLEVGM
jgi:hypothetical protein